MTGAAMRYDIDLLGKRRHWAPSFASVIERVKRILSSTPTIILLTVILVVCLGYFLVLAPLLRQPADQKGQLQELRLQLQTLEQQREALIQEGNVAMQITDLASGWAPLIHAIGGLVPNGLWLSRIALEEEQRPGAPRVTPSTQTGWEPSTKYLVIEGMVDTRRHDSPLEPISAYMDGLRREEGIRKELTSIELVSSHATEDDPGILVFKIKGQWMPGGGQGTLEDRVKVRLESQEGQRS
jgi:hypothetical protein